MNETLYRLTFNFHKVLRQHNSGAVEDFILSHSTVYLRIQKWKNYWNRSTFAKVIVKIKVARFFMAHGVFSQCHAAPSDYSYMTNYGAIQIILLTYLLTYLSVV